MKDISLFFTNTPDSIDVFFDDNKYGYIKLKISKNDVLWTKGYDMYMENMKTRSLCRLHLKNKCNYKDGCMQIHISNQCAAKLKKIVNNVNIFNNCCLHHDDMFTKCNNDITYDIVINEIKYVVPKKYIALTMYFLNKNKSSGNMVSANDICNLHLQNRCFQCSECKYIHICRKFYDDFIIDRYTELSQPNIHQNIESILWKSYMKTEKDDLKDYNDDMEYMYIYKFEKYKKIFGICDIDINIFSWNTHDEERTNPFFEKFNGL